MGDPGGGEFGGAQGDPGAPLDGVDDERGHTGGRSRAHTENATGTAREETEPAARTSVK
ncbi:hypothetical protein GCM10009642_62870 [Nocardiopsis metallicus]